MWSAFSGQSAPQWMVTRLSRHMYGRSCAAILSHPGLAVQQVKALTGNKHQPIVEFLPLFPKEMFADVPRPDPAADEFRVLTVGRCEEFKGAYDLIEIAKRARALSKKRMRFDWCGTGDAIEEARRRVQAEGLTDSFTFHGWTSLEDLAALWGRSHVCLVPTTSRFVEGFNQVVIEAALAWRPVITSAVCPALEFVRPCSIEVQVDDLDGYVRTLVSLTEDRGRYMSLQSRCAEVVRPFFDEANSFGAAVRHALSGLRERGAVEPVAHPPS
jgi:glycosyltransferase involved in cell wall biosynthesis